MIEIFNDICRQLVFSHRQSLLESLKEEEDYAMALHLVVVLLFRRTTNTIIHYPGRLISAIISFLSSHLPRKEHEKLVDCHQLISERWKSMHQASGTNVDDDVSENVDTTAEAEAEAGEANSATDTQVTDPAPKWIEDDKEAAIQTLIQELKQLVQ